MTFKMSFSMLYPLAYLLVGVFAGRLRIDLRPISAKILSSFVIPAVVAYNIATSSGGVFVVIAGVMVAMMLGLGVARIFTKSSIVALCFFYLNIGWLGLPVASSVFGDGAARFFIAMYVGNSIFGNAVASGMFGGDVGLLVRVRHILLSPTALAFYIGLALMPLSLDPPFYIRETYIVFKGALSFLGMAILGMWLSSRPLQVADALGAGRLYIFKSAYWFAVGLIAVLLARLAGFSFVAENAPALGLMALLPPAANIIVVETHHGKTGDSAPLIAWQTIISVLAISLYVGVFKIARF